MSTIGLQAGGGPRGDIPGLTPYVPRPGLEAALRGAVQAGAGAVVVGDAGIGKTRLVDQVIDPAGAIRVGCAQSRFPSASELLAGLLTQTESTPSDLVRLLRGQIVTDGPDLTEGRILAAGRRLGARAGARVLVVEDAERLADAEVALLALAVRSSGCTWVVVSREPLAALPLSEVSVTELTPDEARSLAEAVVPRATPEVLAAVLRRAGGNPLAIEHVALVAATGAEGHEHGSVAAVPTSIRAFVEERLALLPPEEQDLLAVAAVLGDAPDGDLLQHLTGDDGDVLDALVSRGLLRWASEPLSSPVLAFSHALVREAAAGRVSTDRRAAIHRAAADWYAVLPVSQVLESQAHHLEQAVTLGGADCDLVRRAVAAMVLFARSVEEERPNVGLEVVRRARALVEQRPDCGVDTLDLELCSAAIYDITMQSEQAAAAARRAVALADAGDNRRAAAEARFRLGDAEKRLTADDAMVHLAEAEALYRELDDIGGVARVENARGYLAQHEGGIVPQLAAFERAYSLAVRSGDTRLQARSAQELAMHHAFATGRSGFEDWAARARDVGRRDDVGLEPRLDLALASLAMFELAPSRGRDVARRAWDAAYDLGIGFVQVNTLMVSADLAVVGGDLGAAEQFLSDARAFLAERPSTWWERQFDLVAARAEQRRGNVPAAVDLLGEVAASQESHRAVMQRDLAEARAWIALERGHFSEARALAAQALAIDDVTQERCSQLRPRLIDVMAGVASRQSLPLGDVAALKTLSRETGLLTIAEVASRFIYVDELTHGWTVDLYGLNGADTVEVRALDLEIEALSTRRYDVLRDAADVWAQLGATVWRARALLWHTELTGSDHPEATALLDALGSPSGLAELFRAQVRGLRT